MGLRHRLERLEEVYGSGGWGGPPCEECGWHGPDDNPPANSYELTFPGDSSDDDLDHDPQEEFCSTCGRQVVQVLSFPDELDTRRKRTSSLPN